MTGSNLRRLVVPWVIAASLVIISIANDTEIDRIGLWIPMIASILCAELLAVFRTVRWLSTERPHSEWHGAKIVIVAATLALALGYWKEESYLEWAEMLPLVWPVVVTALAFVWTWLSSRERKSRSSDRGAA